MRVIAPLIVTLLCFNSSLCGANDSASSDALTIELRALAGDFAKIIEKKGGGAIAIGEFSASSDVKSSVGPRIQLALSAEFKALKIAVDADSYRFEVKGDYQPLVDKDTGLLGVKVVGRLIDRETGEPLAEKPTGRFVFGAESVPTVLGLNVPLKPNADPRELSNSFKDARDNPKSHVQGTRIATTENSPYAMEILLKSGTGYQAKPVEIDAKGRLLAHVNTSQVYGVRLINDSKHEAAVDLRIDGINCFEFSDIKAKYWIVPAGRKLDVLGWHKNDETTLEFKVVDFPDTAAAKLKFKPSSTIGLITASFSASWEKDSQRPTDEPHLAGRGTGFGAEVEFKTTHVRRTIGQVRDILSVRYER